VWLEIAATRLDAEIAQAIADYVEDYGDDEPPGRRTLTFLFREGQLEQLRDGLRHVATMIKPEGA
jgi:hypothetical protein